MSKRTSAAMPNQKAERLTVSGPTPAPDDEGPRRGSPLARNEWLAVAFVALLALIVRAILLPAQGHVTDVATFEAWMNALIKSGPRDFYGTAGFVDYPPGYMLVLWLVGLVYHATAAYGDFSGNVMRIFVKLPAIVSDIGIGYIVYLIARRSWSIPAAIVAMAVFVLNPASWLVSAFWGQADSVAAVFLVWAIYLAVTNRFNGAWVALAFAVLIKPQPLAVAPLLLIWQIKRQGLSWRLLLVPVLGAAVAYAGSVLFAPTANPVGVLSWLYDRYHSGVGVYPYNSVNALNLYSINRDFFQSDTQPISFFGLELGPQYAWGIGIFLALVVAVGWRLWRVYDDAEGEDAREVTFYTACFIVMLGFFMVLTRQHERYLFSALALAPLVWNAGSILRIGIVILSATFTYNLYYALQYLAAPSADLYPFWVHTLSFVNFVVLVALAGVFLIDEVADWAHARLGAERAAIPIAQESARRRGPNPFEGLAGWTPLDYAVAGAFTIGTLVLLFWNITNPKDRYFDEIYYARAAQEYLQHKDLYEWTHPPLTKLIVALGAWFFGKFGYGDPAGARMANAVMGTLTVPLLYGFAKRLFSSTGAAVAAVVLLLSSGYFYVQSRIATPEISVAFFALLTLYCFYRYWIAGQSVPLVKKPAYPDLAGALAAACFLVALIVLVYAQVALYNAQSWSVIVAPYALAVALFATGVIAQGLFWRRQRERRTLTQYPDGSYIDGANVVFPSGQTRLRAAPPLNDGGTAINWRQDGMEAAATDGSGNRVLWRSDGTVEGVVEGIAVKERQRWGLWLALASIAMAAFVSSKWDGLFGLAALWFVTAACFAQQLIVGLRSAQPNRSRQAAVGGGSGRFAWGNPFGVRLPFFVCSTIFSILVIYVLTYVPNWSGAISTGTSTIGHAGFAGLLSLQYQMYHYHATLNATHLYSSKWWTWPFALRPVSYYYTTISGTTPPNEVVSEIVGLPNPIVWWAGLISVPWAAVLAWRERHKGVALLIVAYFAQWLPWALSPRIDFLYNFYPNLAIICLSSAYVLLHIWKSGKEKAALAPKLVAGGYLAACIVFFIYFLPIWDADHISWTAWINRMWIQGPIVHGWI